MDLLKKTKARQSKEKPTDSGEGCNDWKDFPVVNVRLRPGTAGKYFEAKFQFSDRPERRGIVNFVAYFNDIEDTPRRRERKYPLDV